MEGGGTRTLDLRIKGLFRGLYKKGGAIRADLRGPRRRKKQATDAQE